MTKKNVCQKKNKNKLEKKSKQATVIVNDDFVLILSDGIRFVAVYCALWMEEQNLITNMEKCPH